MVTQYPAQIDTNLTLPKVIDNITPVMGKVFNDLRDAVIALEEELGVKPSSIYGTVRARLDFLENVIDQGGGGGSQTLAQVLTLGNQTGGNSIVLTDGDVITSTGVMVSINSNLVVSGNTTLNSNLVTNGDATINGDTVINGKLTVSGLIDPTGLVLISQGSVPGGVPSSLSGTIWINNFDQHLIFTDDSGTDHDLLASVGTVPPLSQVLFNGANTGGNSIVVDSGDHITINDNPISPTDGANKEYVDAITLSTILAVGNNTGGHNIIMNQGDFIIGIDGATNMPGSDIGINSGNGAGTGAGGSITLTAGTSFGSGNGGNVNLIGGGGLNSGFVSVTGGLVLNGQGSVLPQSSAGVVWVQPTSPSTLWFTNDAGTIISLLPELAPGTYTNETLAWDGASSWVGSATIAITTLNDLSASPGFSIGTVGDVAIVSGGAVYLASSTNFAISCTTDYTIQTSTYNLQPTSSGIIQAGSFVIQDDSAQKVLEIASGKLFGAFAATPIAQPTVTGSVGGNTALSSLLGALTDLGWIINSTD